MTEKPIVTITIHGAADWTKKGRRDVAKWMREKADDLIAIGPEMSKRFTARYLVEQAP